MNKKQARSRSQKRHKEQVKIIRGRKAADERKRAMRNFKLLDMTDDEMLRHVFLSDTLKCFLCNEVISQEELDVLNFVGMRSSTRKRLFFHKNHFYDDETQAVLPDAKQTLQKIWWKVFESEFSEKE